MTGVVVAARRRLAGPYRQHRLASVERLDLRLLVDVQHERLIGRRDVETDDVAHLRHEVGVSRQLERLKAVRLNSEGAPDALSLGDPAS